MSVPRVDLRLGDNRDILATLPDSSVSAIICDPPYEIGFMGSQWDSSGIAYDVDLWRECLRVAKPGAHLAAFGGARTYHRVAVAIEDAGWEIRDSLMWLYSQGMAKSLDVSKAIDKLNGKPLDRLREFGAHVRSARERAGMTQADVNRAMDIPHGCRWWEGKSQGHGKWELHLPARETYARLKAVISMDDSFDWLIEWAEAEREITQESTRPSVIGSTIAFDQRSSSERERRDIPATPDAERWQGWGTALAPAHEPIVLARKPLPSITVARTVLAHGTGAINVEACRTSEGRWPKNVIIDEDVAADLGERARYFYCAKAPTSERPTLDGKGWPTVKPLTLMRWLVRLLTPQGGLVVDPFAGTGTTLQAARDEGFDSLGIERDDFAYDLARQRLHTTVDCADPLSLFDLLDGQAS